MRTPAAVAMGVFFGLAIAVLSYVVEKNQIHLDTILGAIGVIVGALGVVYGAYFAFLAVDAFGHLKVLKEATQDAGKTVDTIHSRVEEVARLNEEATRLSEMIYTAGDQLFISIEAFVAVMPRSGPQKEKLQKLADDIAISRTRVALTNINVKDPEMSTHVFTLIEKGVARDIVILERLLQNKNISEERKSFLRGALATLSQRQPTAAS